MKVNYLFGNGFSIEINDKYSYKNLLRGFVRKFKSSTGFNISDSIEKNPEVYLGNLITSPKIKEKPYQFLVIKLQAHLREYIIERMNLIPKSNKHYKLSDFDEANINGLSTTNYDHNVEEVFKVSFVEHLHGSIRYPEKLLMTSSFAKNFVVDDVEEFIKNLSGEVRIFGLRPGFDKHIWDRLFKNKNISKIVISIKSDQDKIDAEKLKVGNDKIEIVTSDIFINTYWK